MSPSESVVAERLSNLTPEKRQLMKRLLAAKRPHADNATIPRREPSETIPLSYAQLGLWALDQLMPASPFYNEPFIKRLHFPLEVAVLERTLNELLRRHEALRTSFPIINGEPVQMIAPEQRLSLAVVDFRDLSESQREQAALLHAREQALLPFDLSTGPCLRATLLVMGEAYHWLLLVIHHIVVDGWSYSVLSDELSRIYQAFARGEPHQLPELPIQYADYTMWQRRRVEERGIEKQLAYWRARLAGVPPLDVPGDYPRPATPSFRGGLQTFELEEGPLVELKRIAQQHNATTFMVTLAALTVLLHRWSGQDDLVIGVPIANRNRSELEPLIGFFVNPLVLRIDCSGDPTFSELIQRVRTRVLEAFENQEVPFEKLVQELQPERDPGRNPIFQIVFQCNHAASAAAPLALDTSENFDIGTSKFDLRFDLVEGPSQLSGTLEYSSDLYTAETAVRMTSHLRAILLDVGRNPLRKISSMQLLAKAEREQLLVKWNRTQVSHESDVAVHRLFERAAAKFPEASAVVGSGEVMRYGQLNEMANRLASYLRSKGVCPEERVVVCTGRKPHMIMAWLAVWKAGGAYVPLDASHPAERLCQMVCDAAPKLIITDEASAEKFVQIVVPRLTVDSDRHLFSHLSGANLAEGACAANLAYVIYTSGSTGVPRGVAVEHRALANLVGWHRRAYSVTDADRATQVASPAFDASVWEVWPYLLSGASVHIATNGAIADPARLLQWLVSEGITLSFLPTPLAEALLDTEWPIDIKLRALLTGGDRLRRGPLHRPPFRFTNHYGPTENTVVATWADVDPDSGVQIPPIGRPIDNVRAYVLDQAGQPVPIGIPGELCLAGGSLARGYLGREDWTKEKFIYDMVSFQERLYKTGDLVRYRSDGNLEFLGRMDHQVKLRGHRLELGEIESTILRVRGIKEAVVICREDQPGHRRLVAYVKPSEDGYDNVPTVAKVAQGAQVSEWHRLYEETYVRGADAKRPDFNIVGWNSSYTGEPIPTDEMLEQVEQTVARLQGFQPRRVLEIGCGTGLLLFRLAPLAEEYVGTDFSSTALNFVQGHLSARGLKHVRLLERMADCFDGFAPSHFDLVILNSVVQYFPGAEYLVRVLKGALMLLTPGGRLFVGDVRSLPLQEAFCADVELHRATAETQMNELRDRWQRRIKQEPELTVAPELFTRVAALESEATETTLLLKRGVYHNELTRFRYDAIMRRGAYGLIPSLRKEWGQVRSMMRLRELLRHTKEAIVITGVPNARVLSACHRAHSLRLPSCPSTVADILTDGTKDEYAMDPEAFSSLESSLSWRVYVSPSATSDGSCFDVTFVNREVDLVPISRAAKASRQPWTAFTNAPLERSATDRLELELRRRLHEMLPEYMVPAAFVVMPALPRTLNGKLDRKNLPAPDRVRSGTDREFVAPRTKLERRIAALWQEVLGAKEVGVNDNFFDLGGHSLLMIRLHARLREELSISHSVTDLFRYPTVSALAKSIGEEIEFIGAPRE